MKLSILHHLNSHLIWYLLLVISDVHWLLCRLIQYIFKKFLKWTFIEFSYFKIRHPKYRPGNHYHLWNHVICSIMFMLCSVLVNTLFIMHDLMCNMYVHVHDFYSMIRCKAPGTQPNAVNIYLVEPSPCKYLLVVCTLCSRC